MDDIDMVRTHARAARFALPTLRLYGSAGSLPLRLARIFAPARSAALAAAGSAPRQGGALWAIHRGPGAAPGRPRPAPTAPPEAGGRWLLGGSLADEQLVAYRPQHGSQHVPRQMLVGPDLGADLVEP